MSMTQNLVTLNLSDDQLAVVDQALFALESQLTTLIALNVDQRRSLRRMGVKSEAFCRKTLSVLEQNPQVVPSSLSLSDAQADLSSLDKLRPRVQRLQRLSERAVDTEIALGSDVMMTALQGYALLKVSGKNQGLEGLRRSLGAQFKATRTAEPEAA
jgi:Leucine-rich repeat (LRR) protein